MKAKQSKYHTMIAPLFTETEQDQNIEALMKDMSEHFHPPRGM